MIYYLIFFILVIIICIAIQSKSKIINTYISYCIIVILALFAGLRDNLWTDWDMYYTLFTNISINIKDFELGYIFWNKIVGFFTSNYNVFLTVTYFILLIILYKTVKINDNKYYNVSFIVLYSVFYLSSSGMRQFIAMIIILYSIKYIINKDLKKYIIIVIFASFFHRTSLIFIPVAYLYNKKFKIKHIAILIGICLIFYKINIMINILNFITNTLSGILSASVLYRINRYTVTLSTENLMSFGFIRKTIILIYFIYIRERSIVLKKSEELQKKYNIYFNIYFIGYVISIFIYGIFSRIESYFYLTECILFPLSLKLIKDSNNRLIIFVSFILLYLLILYFRLKNFYPELYIPYRWIL